MENNSVLNIDYMHCQALEDVMTERIRQDNKWGVQNQHPLEWLSILQEEVGEYATEINEGHFGGWTPERVQKMRTEAVQASAVALAIVECIDRNPSLYPVTNNNVL